MLAISAVAYRQWNAGEETDQPAAQGASTSSIEDLRARAEGSPDDPGPWQMLGFAHFQRGEFSEAAEAYRQAVAANGEEAVLWSALGEALVMASERDPMPPQALAAFRTASELDPRDPRARYFLAVDRDLRGDHEGAISDWLALLSDTPSDAPWEYDLIRTIEQVGAINAIEVDQRIVVAREAQPFAADMSGGSLPGPSSSEIAAAGQLSPTEQRQMAEGMVARLEGRLVNDPQNLEGWVMLMRSRMTLGQPDRARSALSSAIAANPAQEARLRQEADALGIR